ncbi:MAG TPA: hypothetical protein VGF75_07780, partial [Candidatus Saccharimonadales bacterium]
GTPHVRDPDRPEAGSACLRYIVRAHHWPADAGGADGGYSVKAILSGYKIDLPFELKVQMPATDLGKKGYSRGFAKDLDRLH